MAQVLPSATRVSGGALGMRLREPRDAADLFALFNEPEFRESALMRDPFDAVEQINPWLDRITASRRFELVVTCEGACVAFGALYVHGEHFDHCGSLTMGVRRAFARQGVGALLVRGLLATAQDFAGLSKVVLTVLTDNAAAIRLYRRHGFIVEGLHRRFARRGAAYCDAYAMARLLEHATTTAGASPRWRDL